MCERSNKGGVKGEGIVAKLGFVCSPLRGSQTHIVCALQAYIRFARFGLPLTHFKEKGLFVVSPYEGLDGYPSGTLQNPSTGRIFGRSTVLRLTADGNGYRYR